MPVHTTRFKPSREFASRTSLGAKIAESFLETRRTSSGPIQRGIGVLDWRRNLSVTNALTPKA
jgi:hypothetical protein